jgi:hypothetical protein
MTPEQRTRLDEAIRAVCPIHGTSGELGALTIHYNGATSQQQTNAQAVVSGYDSSQAAFDLWKTQATSKVIGRQTAVRLTVDRSTTQTSYQNVVGLSFELAANTHYAFTFDGAYTAAAGTTGIQLALNGPTTSFLAYGVEIATSTTAWTSALAASFDVGANATASGGATALPFHIFGNLTTTAAGLLIVRGRSEVNGSAVTIKAGSYGLLSAVG